MKSGIGFVAAAAMAMTLAAGNADAGPFKRKDDKKLFVSGLAVGAVTTAGYFALRDWRLDPARPKLGSGAAAAVTTVGCMGLSPIVGTIMVGRELTLREAYVMTADCVIPFVGGWLMNKAFDRHPEWERKAKVARKR